MVTKELDLSATQWKSETLSIAERNAKARAYSRRCREKREIKRAVKQKVFALTFGTLIGLSLYYDFSLAKQSEKLNVEVIGQYEVNEIIRPETVVRNGILLNGFLYTDDGNYWEPLDPPEDNGKELPVEVVFASNGTETAEDDWIIWITETENY